MDGWTDGRTGGWTSVHGCRSSVFMRFDGIVPV